MDISSKTLENSFLVINQQTWTNLKQHISTMDREAGPDNAACGLCNVRENTMHLLFDCEKYSEPLWHELGNVINLDIEMQNPGGNRVELQAHNILYNLDIAGYCFKIIRRYKC